MVHRVGVVPQQPDQHDLGHGGFGVLNQQRLQGSLGTLDLDGRRRGRDDAPWTGISNQVFYWPMTFPDKAQAGRLTDHNRTHSN